jgi:arylsulfatase A-like enzyme
MIDQQPDVILITADELHQGALSCYGNRAVETPTVDGLAAGGYRYDQAYTVSPWCLPARSGLVTGRFPRNSGAYTNYAGWEGRLDPTVPNLYTLLGDAGYRTAHVGKCHYAPIPFEERTPGGIEPYDRNREYYRTLGIDDLVLQDGKLICTWFDDDYGVELAEAGHREAYRRAVDDEDDRYVFSFPGPAEWHPDSWVGRKAVEYLASYDRDEPLFLWVSFDGPHYPFDPPASYLDRVDVDAAPPRTCREDEYEDEGKVHYGSYHGGETVRRVDANGVLGGTKELDEAYWTDLRRHYFANVAQVDEQVGRILDTLDATRGEALVTFVADHGDMLGNHSLWGKHNCAYEDVLNVPLVVSPPGDDGGDPVDATVQLPDVTATILEHAGVDGATIDGRPLAERARHGGRDLVFAEGGGFAAVSDGEYKYVHVSQNGERYTELYDLVADPDEFEDRSEDPEARSALARLRGEALDRYLDAATPFYSRPIDL